MGVISFADPWSILYKEMKEVLKQKNLSHKPISFIKNMGGTAPCRMSGEQPALLDDLILKLTGLNEAGYKEAADDILKLYSFKTNEDVKKLKVTHQVAVKAIAAFYKYADTGISEAVLAAHIEFSVQEMVGNNNITFAQAWPLVQSGNNTVNGGKYNKSSGKIIREGDWVMLEMALCVDGYWTDITRTTVVGKATDLQLDIFAVVSEAQQKAIEMLKLGVAMCEADRGARNHIALAGYGDYFNHVGHQTGFRYHDSGGRFAPDWSEVLKEGMVMTVEPGIYGDALNGGMRIEDNSLITANGCEILSDYPRSIKGN